MSWLPDLEHLPGDTRMELTKIEMTVVEETTQEAARNDIRELAELQLALVGGGIGDVLVA